MTRDTYGSRRGVFKEETGSTEDIKSISCGKHGKLHNNLKTSYYERDGYVVTINKGTIKITRPGFKWQLKRELLLDRRIVKKSGKMSLAVYRLLAVLKKRFKKHPVWIVSDRDNAGGDNGEALFRYLAEHEKDAKVYFAIDPGCKDYSRIRTEGRVLKLNSFRYKLNFLAADKILSSQTGEWVTNAFGDDRKYMKSLYDFDYCFLQHGITLNDISSWFEDYKRDIAFFGTAARREYEAVSRFGFCCNEETVNLTGFPRFDYLTDDSEKKIVFLPTWRRNIAGETVPGTAHRYYSESFKDSDYCKYYNALINDERLVKCLSENGYTGELYIHPAFSVQARDFTGNDVIRVREGVADYNKLMRENSLLITDYSSVVFDFAYLKSPVVYTQFDVEEFLSGHHCSEGYFDYEKDGFGPVATDLESTVDEIIKAIDSGCIMADKYRERVDGFFAFTDKNNCERVYKAIKALDKKTKDEPSEVSSEARVRSHSFEAGKDAVNLTLDVKVSSDSAFSLKDEVIIDTDLGSEESENGASDGRDNRYPIEMISQDHLGANGGTIEVEFTVAIPYERALQMERYNRVYLILDKNGSEEMLRLINDKRREGGIARVIPVPDSSAAIYFNDTLKLFKVEVRERLHTDDPKEQRRLERAWKFSRLTKKHKPIVMYEKDCSRYEESASAVYEALIDRGYRDVYFILDKKYAASADIAPKYRKNIIDRFSFRHYYELFCAKSIVSTETIGHSLERGSVSIPFEKHVMRGKKNYVFLQHGVMYMVPLSAEQRKFFSRPGAKGKQRVVVSSELEAQHFLQNTSYDSREKLYMSGLPKFDRSFRHDDADKIVIMVTWRPWDYNMMTKDPKATSYFRFVERLYDSIPDHLKERTVIAPHPLVTKLMKENGSDAGIWAGYDPDVKYDDLLKDCDVLITDYSSIAYDAFYRGCNVIFCWEQLDECMKHYGKDAKLMLTEDLAFGPVCYNIGDVTDAVEKIYKTEHDPRCVSNFRKIVEFSDGKNTERVVEMLAKDGII